MRKFTEIINDIVGARPFLSSALVGWEGILLEEYHLPACYLPDYETSDFRLTLQLSRALPVEFRQGNQLYQTSMSPGSFCFTPPGVKLGVSWPQEREVLHITLAQSLVTEVLSDYFIRPQADFVSQKGSKDEQVYHLGLALRSELQAGNPSGSALCRACQPRFDRPLSNMLCGAYYRNTASSGWADTQDASPDY